MNYYGKRFSFLSILVVALSVVLTGCYTQLSTMDQQRMGPRVAPQAEQPTAERPAETEAPAPIESVQHEEVEYTSDDYAVTDYANAQAGVVNQWHSSQVDVGYARHLYEMRARGAISYSHYRNALLDLHYANPFRFHLTPALFYDPLYSPYISSARFSAIIIHGNVFGWSPFHRTYAFSPWYPRTVYRPGFHLSFHTHFYGPYHHFRYPHHFAYRGFYSPYWHSRPYRVSQPFAVQRGSTFGVRSATIGHGRVGTSGRVVSTQPVAPRSDRVGTVGRAPTPDARSDRDAITIGDDSELNGRVGTSGRAARSDAGSSTPAVQTVRIPQRLEAPERRAPQTRGTTRTTQRDYGNRTERQRGNTRTTRDRGNTPTTRSTGNTRTTRSSGNTGTTRSSGTSTSRDRGSTGSSRGSSSRRGGNE